MRTYTYINHKGIKKQLNVGDKTKDGKYPTSLYAVREGIPCECCGTNVMSEEELEKYIKHYKASPTGAESEE